MIKTMIASKGLRLAATCMCPVVGTGVVTMTVPPVRHAVNRLTGPHEYALPKTRVRPAVAAPCAGAVPIDAPAVALAPFVSAPPIAGAAAPIGDIASVSTPPVTEPLIPGGTLPGGEIGIPGGPGTPVLPGALPDARTWLQLTLGFGLVGGAARFAHSRVATV